MSKKSIKDEFILKLMDKEISLDDRLNIAYGALISQDFPVVGKEQIVIDWFPDCFKIHDKNSKTILKSLVKCLTSDSLTATNEAIDATKLIEGFSQLEKSKKTKHSKVLLNCLLTILKNSGFQRHCRFDIQPFIEALLLALELLTHSASKDNLTDSSYNLETSIHVVSTLDELLEDVLGIFKSTQQRDELKIHLIEDIFPTLLLFSSNYDFKTSPKFQILMEEIVIGEETEVLINLFKTNVKGKIPFHLKGVLKLLNKDGANNIPTLLIPLLFEACVKASLNNKTGREIRFTLLLYTLISFMGFKLQLPFETVETCYKPATRLGVLRELMEVLQRHNVSTTTEADEGVLGEVLVTLLKQLISEEQDMTPDLLRAVQSILKVHPDSARIAFRPFLKNIMFRVKDSADLEKAYDDLLTDVVKIFLDLNQIEKLFSLFFDGAAVLTKGDEVLSMTNKMILSCGFFAVLTEKLPSLTGNHLRTILGKLEKVFSKELLPHFESATFTERNFNLMLNLWVDVLCHVLENSCLALSTRWNIISDTINHLVESIQQFGQEIIKSSDVDHLHSFLRLVRVLADVESLITYYVVSLSSTKLLPPVKSKDKTKSVYNLAKSHGFLAASEWNQIAETVMESWNVELKHCWFDLLAQKLSRQGDLEVMTYLVLNAGSDWLWQNVVMLSGNVPLKHLELYSEHLLADNCFRDDQDFNEKLLLLQSMSVMSHRDLRLALSLQCVKQISKTLPDKHSLAKNMTKLTDVTSVIKGEAALGGAGEGEGEEVPVTLQALVEVMNKCQWEERDTAEQLEEEATTRVTRLLSVLASMNIYGFKSETKRTICTTLMGLSYDLRRENHLLTVILDMITGCLDEASSVLADSLDRRVLLMWLSTVVPPGYPLRHTLSRLGVLKVIPSLDQGVEGMTQLLQSDHGLLAAVLEAVLQVQGNKAFKGNEEFLKLVKLLVGLACSIVAKKPKAKFLRLYTVAVQAEFIYLKSKSPVLLGSLQDYLEFLFRRLEEHAATEPNSAELIDFVLSNKVDVDAGIKEFVYSSMTRELCKTGVCPMLSHPTTIKTFLEAIPSQRFEQVLESVYKHQHENKEDWSCEFWQLAVTAQLDKDKCKCRQKLLVQVLSDCVSHLQTDSGRFQPVVVRLLHSVSTSKSITMSGRLLDLVLLTLGLAPTDSDCTLLPECLSTLNCLLTHRSELVFDRIPVLLQRLRKFLSSLVKCSSVDVEENNRRTVRLDYAAVSDSVNQVTRIVKTMVDQHSKHFARTAPYLIADFLHLLVTHSIETSIKNELENCVCLLLVLCDNHGVQLLQNRQSLASTELFKSLSAHKSYKYTGKV